MDSQKNKKTDLGHAYLDARQEVDELCRNIVTGAVTAEKALESYEKIERLYAQDEPLDLEFFRMIYRSRVVRLIDQFIPGPEK